MWGKPIFRQCAFLLMMALCCASCAWQKTHRTPYVMTSPDFNADSAYTNIAKQLDFGYRIPGTSAHQRCADFLCASLRKYGAEVMTQTADVVHYTGDTLTLTNIMATYNPTARERILLAAHWDTRPFADEDIDSQRQQLPIDGADDGASGVAIVLEVARLSQLHPIDIGVDIVLFDLEDWGEPSFATTYVAGDWWCVGSRHWATWAKQNNYRANYGILLDMVGATGATFYKEGHSMMYAPRQTRQVWKTAKQLGYDSLFVNKSGAYITDDHIAINEIADIPCVNIINHSPTTSQTFPDHWHTAKDNIDIIDRQTLKAVGQVVLELLYTH